MKYFVAKQNNIRGDFIGPYDYIIVETPHNSEAVAEAIAKEIVGYGEWNDYCHCCGQRWGLDYDNYDSLGEAMRCVSAFLKENKILIVRADGSRQKRGYHDVRLADKIEEIRNMIYPLKNAAEYNKGNTIHHLQWAMDQLDKAIVEMLR